MLNLQSTQTFYSDKVNSQFHKSQSHYVGLAQRLRETINNESWKETVLADAVEGFKTKFAEITKWAHFKFCKAQSTTLDKIVIDITLQRMLNIVHVANIIDQFRQIKIMPICVYQDPAQPGKYICWDGQHTAIVLYVIANMLKLDISKCQIPIVIYPSEEKSEMRENFIGLNGPDKSNLDHIDIVQQKIFGVRTDGNTNPDWVLVEQKQQAYENAKMFLTHTKFGDANEGGAQARLEEFLHPAYDLSITEAFTKYFFKVCYSSRPVQPKESWLMYEYFRLAKVSGIALDDVFIREVAQSLRTAFNNDFDAIALLHRAKTSYQEWWRANKPYPDGTLQGIRYPEKPMGLTFLIAQIDKNLKKTKGPKLLNPLWPVDKKDLF